MSRRGRYINKVPIIENSDSEDEESPPKKLKSSPNKEIIKETLKRNDAAESSSSESDIENYLQPINKLDLSSKFFNLKKNEEFSKIENNILDGVSRLSDSESDQEDKNGSEENKDQEMPTASKSNFQQLEDFTRKIEEAKLQVEKYNAKKEIREKNQDISNLLAAGENKQLTLENIKEGDLHSSDFETTDDEWEEVKTRDVIEEKPLISKQNIEIRLGDMPSNVKKKKGLDLLAAMKRRLNRIRKENQIYVHKVHLLCWIAHGNYLNAVINKSDILAQALKLLPSDKCYPSDRPDLGYLEQIVQWYKKTIRLIEKPPSQELTQENSLKLQMKKKEAYCKNSYVLIFISIMRALGIQCRLVLSLQVESLRPPSTELHSLSTKENDKNKNAPSTSKLNQSKCTLKTKSKPDLNKNKSQNKSDSTNKIHSNKIKSDGKKPNLEKLKSSTNKKNMEDNKDNKTSSSRTSIRNKPNIESKSKDHEEKPSQRTSLRNEKKQIAKKDTLSVEVKKLRSKSPADGKDKLKVPTAKTNKNTLSAEINKRSSKSKTDVNEKSKKTSKETLSVATKKMEDNKDNKASSSRTSTRNKTNNETKSKEHEEKPSQRTSSRNEKKSIAKDTLSVEVKKLRSKSATDGTDKLKTNKNNLSVEVNKRRSKSITDVNDKLNEINTETLTVEIKKSRSKSPTVIKNKSKKTNNDDLSVEEKKPSSRTKPSTIKIKLPKYPRSKKSEEKEVPQLDGANDEDKPKRSSKPNLGKLNNISKKVCTVKKHSSRLTSSQNNDDSENEFSSSPLKQSPQKGIHFSKLQSPNSIASSSKFDIKNDIINLIKGRISEQKEVDRNKLANKRLIQNNDDSDSDYMPEPLKKKRHSSGSEQEYFVPKTKVKKRIKVKKEGDKLKVLSSDDETEKKKKKGVNIWIEVFLESEEKWITADVIRGQVHCVNELFMRASHPVSYVVAWNNDDSLKDVTMRYCRNFNTVTRKLRIDAKWWDESLKPFLEKSSARSKEEDNDLNMQQSDQPLPTTISEYKNHPLYALRRHILKFEAIYPSDIIPLGYVRGEPVYPRNSVYTCRSREIWVKEARVVKPGEVPYKVVKARPKYDKLSNQVITDQLLEIFGEWQTTEYVPPTAENGIVPRNAYGNVELFKECMLPKGTVLLKLPGLNKVCRKLNIDCASAIVGFDFHGGWSHPVYDGFVICKEFEDTCIAAWHEEQQELERKENEKIEKRVYTNWKKLIKGLLIRERLKARYDFGGETFTGGKGKKKEPKGPRFSTKKRRSPLPESDSD